MENFTLNELEPFLVQFDQSARESCKLEREKQDSFDQNIIDLYRSVLLYRKIKTTLSPPDPNLAPDMAEQLQVADVLYDPSKDKDLTAEYARFRELTKELSSRPEDIRMGSADFAKVVFFLIIFEDESRSEFFPIPPESDDPKKQWRTIGESLVGKEPLDSQESKRWSQQICEYPPRTGCDGIDSPESKASDILKTRKWIHFPICCTVC